MKRALLLVLAVPLLVLAACGDDDGGSTGPGGGGEDGGSSDPFGDTTWILTEGTVDGAPLELIEGYEITLSVAGGQVSGRSACNNYFGEITVDGSDVSIGGVGSTEMGCPEPGVMELEQAYLSALARVTTASREGDALSLEGEGVSFRFTATPEVPDASLAGTDWTLETMLDGETASSTVAGAQPTTLRIEDDGTLTGHTGCNQLSSRAEVVDGRLALAEDLVQTDIACDELVMDQERHVLDVLGAEPAITIEGDRLTLLTDSGLGLVYRAS